MEAADPSSEGHMATDLNAGAGQVDEQDLKAAEQAAAQILMHRLVLGHG